MQKREESMTENIQFVDRLVQKGGPDLNEYQYLSKLFHDMERNLKANNSPQESLQSFQQIFGDVLGCSTLKGFVFQKPHGYAGDYEIIDKIYTQTVSHDPRFSKWDLFFHAQSACRAVRNRKQYFIDVLSAACRQNPENTTWVLNVGSGPGRDMQEFFSQHPETDTKIECVDLDANAIAFASSICQEYKSRLIFHNRNIFRYRTTRCYEVVWSAGLFDYLNDKLFKHLFRHLFSMVSEGGELVIGNFTPKNPSRTYMDFLDWVLIHRDEDTLRQLALECGAKTADIRIGFEPEGVNLFLHVTKPSAKNP